MRIRRIIFVGILVFALFSCKTDTSSEWSILKKGNELHIKAGILERKITFSKNVAFTTSVFSNGNEIISGSKEFSVSISKVTPNAEPVGIRNSNAAGVSQQDSEQNNTDALNVQKNDFQAQNSVKWINNENIAGDKSELFGDVSYSIESPEPGKTRLELSYKLNKEWEGVSAKIIYEIYENHPAIRKWIEFSNEGELWVKIENLTIDDLHISETYSNQTLLAPDSRDICSSLIAFHDSVASCGIISASEVPSKLRLISGEGASGYHPDYFEWVLGPSESFVSEPVFIYGFSGESYPTISSVSTAFDRTVETNFQTFLKQHILRLVEKNNIAPVFCTWTNYGADINDKNMRDAAEIASRMGFKCFQLDAGWSDTEPDGGWAVSTPNPNMNKFPDLKDLNQFILSKNMKAGLWYSVFINEQLVDKNEDPVLYSLPLIKRAGGLGLSFCYDKSREQYINDIVYLHKTYGADYFKQDLSNVCYGDIARGHESRTIKESYLRGLRGMLSTQDEIHKKAPKVWLQLSHEIYWETPGPEADIAVLKHADSYHTAPNEYWGAGHRKQLVNSTWKYNVQEIHDKLIKGAFVSRNLWYAHRGLPLDRIEIFGAVTTNFQGSLSAEVIDRQICSWFMGAPLSFSGDLTSLTEENIEQYKSRFAMLEQLQQKYEVYSRFQYSGVPQPTDADWHWWGKLNSEGCGAVIVLRGSAGEDERKINIPWVLPGKEYRVKGLFSQTDFGTFKGKELQDGILSLRLSAYGQEIIEVSGN